METLDITPFFCFFYWLVLSFALLSVIYLDKKKETSKKQGKNQKKSRLKILNFEYVSFCEVAEDAVFCKN